jgi:serine/threonine protein kinase/class 3 adenylate cyclase
MDLGRFCLLTQLSAGKDGVAYRAEGLADGQAAEVRVVTTTDPERRARLLKRLRQAALLEHGFALRILGHDLEHDPPYVALELPDERTWPEDVAARLPLPWRQAAAMVRDLAEVLAAGHRLGLTLGDDLPRRIRSTPGRPIQLDFTGLDTEGPHLPEPLESLTAACRPPATDVDAPHLAADLYGLGVLLFWLLTAEVLAAGSSGEKTAAARLELTRTGGEDGPTHQLGQLVEALLSSDPAARPPARDVAGQLAALLNRPRSTEVLGVTGDYLPDELAEQTHEPLTEPSPKSGPTTSWPEQLGRFQLVEKLGEGGMGAVFRALDRSDGSTVAIKLLRPDWARKPTAVRRFLKEARLLAEVNNPHVANLLEVNEDEGIHYLVLEFVAGKSLGTLLTERGNLDEPTALAILADVSRALVEAHEHGIVHRDIKPDNILLADEPGDRRPRVRLTDFGIARHVVESESLNVTQAGAVLGTPYYMAPEQCAGRAVDPRTDVYSLGATLFHLLAGRPPFVADNPLGVMAQHTGEPPPALDKLNPVVSEAVCQVVARMLAKHPDARYPNAAALLRDLERLLRGEPTSLAVHPRLPDCDARNVLAYDFPWELDATPEQLWPHVSNTERLNRAVGIPAVQFRTEVEEKSPTGRPRVHRFGELRKAGMTAAWEEHPFEWIEARRFGVLREYSQGPFKWLVSIVELTRRPEGGTGLVHRVRLEPRGLLGRTVAAVEVGLRGRRALDRVYRRIDAAVTGRLGDPATTDPFVEPDRPSGTRRRRLDELLDQLVARHIDATVVERLGAFLAEADILDVARIRPLALARRLALDPEQVVAACLHGAREGLLVLLWDILCPVCRIPSEVKDTLRALREHGRCEACNLDFELDFANSVELIFRAHPEVRDTRLGVYCIGGPVHSPHVVAQARVGAGECVELELNLTEGAYRLRGPQLPFAIEFRVEHASQMSRWDLSLSQGLDPALPRALKPGGQMLALANDYLQELVVRVERAAPRGDALTAARASSLALFRELFPGEILAPGQLVSIATVTLLATALDQPGNLYEELGDAKAFALIHEHFRLLEARIRREGGALVKTVGEGVLASFSEPVAAVRAAVDLTAVLAGQSLTAGLRLRVGVQRGPAMVATLNDHLDYFGTTVSQVTVLAARARGGELVLSQDVAADPAVASLLRLRGLEGTVEQADLPGRRDAVVQRFHLNCAPVPSTEY